MATNNKASDIIEDIDIPVVRQCLEDLKEETTSAKEGVPDIFVETPYRKISKAIDRLEDFQENSYVEVASPLEGGQSQWIIKRDKYIEKLLKDLKTYDDALNKACSRMAERTDELLTKEELIKLFLKSE